MAHVLYDLSLSNEKVSEKYNSYERHVTVVDQITKKLMISRGGVTRWRSKLCIRVVSFSQEIAIQHGVCQRKKYLRALCSCF